MIIKNRDAQNWYLASSSRYVTESGNGRPDIDLRSYVATGWGPLVSFHPTAAPVRSSKGGSEQRQSRFHRWLPRGLNPPSSLSRRCLVYLQWRRRDAHLHTHTNRTVEKAVWGDGIWGMGRKDGEGDDFRCRRSQWVSSKKRRNSHWWHVRNRHVQSAFGADSGRVDVDGVQVRKHRERLSSSCTECDAVVVSRASRSSEKIVALNSHIVAPAVRHETWMTYGIARIEKLVRAKRDDSPAVTFCRCVIGGTSILIESRSI